MLVEGKSETVRSWARLAALVLLFAALGLPVNDLYRYGLLLVGTVVIFSGRISLEPRSWLVVFAIVAASLAGRMLVPAPPIEEGHNIFLVDRPGGALEQGLPAEAYRLMASEFEEVYPPQARCQRENGSCWLAQGRPASTFAFSADGLWDHPEYSRRTATIDFSDTTWLRLGFTNEIGYNWISSESDLKRLRRDGRFWMGLHRWHLLMPWFVMYRFPQEFVGSTLCWHGDVIWEEAADRFSLLRHPQTACRTIDAGSIGRRIFGLGIRPDTLAMTLNPTISVLLRDWLNFGLMAIAAIGVLALLVRADRRSCRLPLLLIAASLVVIAIADASFIGGFRPLDGAEDSLNYEGAARQIADDLWHGHLLAALRGGEDVFYFGGSSFRYPRAFERFIFGDTYLGYLSVVLAFPMLMYLLFRRLFSVRWALALIFIFVVVPVGRLFGTTFTLYAMWAVRGFADPLAVIIAVAGYFVLIGVDAQRPLPTGRAAFWASFLFAISVVIRPNGAMFAAVMLTGAGLALLYRRHWSRYALLCLGFVPIILPGLHNWYFGHVFVPFVSNWSHPLALSMPPSAWFDAVVDLVRLNWTSEPLGAAVHRLGEWLSGPTESLAMVPVHAAAIAILVDVMVRRAFDPWIRLTALAVLCQHLAALGFSITPRYHLGAWLFTYLVVVVWVRQSGIGMFQRMFPQWSETIRNSSAYRKTAVLLDDFQRWTAVRERHAG